jgi:hypothetical protein
MSLTDTVDKANDACAVVPLDVNRRRRRLEHLLDLRTQLSQLAAERRAHRLEDALDVFGQQMAVEQALEDEFPGVYAERFAAWSAAEAALAHEPTTLTEGCGICEAIASKAGINLTPPEAA